MAKIPVRFKRVAEAFEEVVKGGRVCESSGSEHSPEASMDLSDLVNSFMERDQRRGDDEEVDREKERIKNGSESESYCSDSELKDTLQGLLGCGDDNDELKRNVRAEAEQACRVIGNTSSPSFKRQLMTWLRERGFDAGLCKSKWERNGRISSGSYEYIDVNFSGARYIIEVSLAGEFQIARPKHSYTSLLNLFPPIFVGRVEELKQVVTLMCNAVKDSMKTMDMPVPPWRRSKYVQAKWFGSYKRTTNEVPAKTGLDFVSDSARKRSIGFVPLPTISYHCREDFASKSGLKVGKLTMEFDGTDMLLQTVKIYDN